ncbi:MoaA/NifB/PqqE/SkfB family radical SAM enzyme [Bradyrhizobium japonicum]
MPTSQQSHIHRGIYPRYDSILLSVTERCHVGCSHCGFIGTKREREASIHELCDWVDQFCAYGGAHAGIRRLIMTGGEPFERLGAVEAIVSVAAPRIPIVSTFTSSFWARTLPESRAILRRLSGLKQLYLSSDFYHQQRVPYEYVANAIQAGIDQGVEYITICITYGNDAQLVEVKKHYEKWGNRIEFYEERVIPTPYLAKRVLASQSAGAFIEPAKFGATCWLQTPLINPDGGVYACHSGKAAAHRDIRDTPYYLGSLRESSFVDIAKSASRRWDYQYLRTQGPRGVAIIANEDARVLEGAGRREFTSACDMCFSILKTKAGKDALSQKTSNPEVRDAINIRLALGLSEDPIES